MASKAWWVGLLLLIVAPPARGAAMREEARAHYEFGRIEFEKGRYAEALEAFRRAYEVVPIPDLLYNFGRCQERLGQIAAAIGSYERYLDVKPNAEEQGELQRHIQELKLQLPPAGANKTEAPAQATSEVKDRTARGHVPVYRRWWLWTVVGATAVVGLGVGLGVGLTRAPSLGIPATDFRP